MAAVVQVREVDNWLQQFADMRSDRSNWDRKCQLVSDYILPRRDFSTTQRPNQIRPHRVTSSVATNANTRMAAWLLTYLIDPTRPFLLPNVKRGLVASGRPTDLEDDAQDYLTQLQWSVFDHMMLPKAQLMQRLGSMLKEFCAFGCGVMWTGRKRGFGPYFNARPVQACWWSENEEGEIDTLYFKMLLPLHRVFQRFPEARTVEGWADKVDKPASDLQLTPIILGCRPRAGGQAGAVVENKPYAFVAISEEKKVVLETSGYDSFPYGVYRYDPMPGSAYAEGVGCQVLPDVMVLNHLQEAIESGASQKAAPAIAVPARMFGRQLDRRPTAVNAYNPQGLGLMRADQAIIKLDFSGDITEAKELIQVLTNNIELGYFTDWLRLRESGDMTAEEVGERRDLRLRGAASIVANCELPMTIMGDRCLEIMNEERLTAPAPASIAGTEVDWEYAGPLAVAQLRGNVQASLQLMNAAALVDKNDPGAGKAVNHEELLRVIAESLAAPTRVMNSRQKVAADRAAEAHAQMQQMNAAKLAQVAGAARDGGQGLSSMADAAQTAGGPPGAPPMPGGGGGFAPASPFAGPSAVPVAA